VLAVLDDICVPGGPIYSVADMMSDPHFNARELFEEVDVEGRPLKIPAILPKLETTPGSTRWPGPKLGQHTDEVLTELAGLNQAELTELREANVIR
jgi:crotonobetainyl-CoA:carnitine CoA-transferase CaiB-like acyl-CoA transferase